jgi:uncharacterized membrane protein YdjX (TVP38/TMEM64 family)
MATWLKLVLGAALIVVAILLGRDLARHLPALEAWIARHGIWGFLAFVGLVVLCTSLFVPDTVFALAAGVLFGLAWGSVAMVLAAVLTASLNFVLARRILAARVGRWLKDSPRLAALLRAVEKEGLRFQLLLRLAPIHPVTANYVIGASGVRYPTFLFACLGLIPGLFVEVYFGYAAKHMARTASTVGGYASPETILTVGGLLVCVALLLYITRLAGRALAAYQPAA